MKITWHILGSLALAISAIAQTNEPLIQVKEYHAKSLTNQIYLGIKGEPMFFHGEVEAVYETRFKFELDAPLGKNIIIQKYPNLHSLANGQQLFLWVQQIGTIRAVQADGTPSPDTVLELWEYQQPRPTHPTPEAIAAAKLKREQDAKAAAAKAYQIQVKVIEWLKPQATNGDASAQFSLGVHYLNGIGCETNRETGIYWLQAAADKGNIDASNKLAYLSVLPAKTHLLQSALPTN